jgi:allophanate hydrolase subunit 1
MSTENQEEQNQNSLENLTDLISENEYNEIMDLINRYQQNYQDATKLNNDANEIQQRYQKLQDKILRDKRDEEELLSRLKSKYGDFNINIEDFAQNSENENLESHEQNDG